MVDYRPMVDIIDPVVGLDIPSFRQPDPKIGPQACLGQNINILSDYFVGILPPSLEGCFLELLLELNSQLP